MHGGYQRTIVPNKNRKILSQKNHLTKIALGESSGVEIQASRASPEGGFFDAPSAQMQILPGHDWHTTVNTRFTVNGL